MRRKNVFKSSGDLFLTPANIEHNVLQLSNDASIYSFRFHFCQSDNGDNSQFLRELRNSLKDPLKIEGNDKFLELVKQLRWELANLTLFSSEKIQSLLKLIYTEFFRCLFHSSQSLLTNEPFSVTFEPSNVNKLPNYQKKPPREFYMDILDEFFTHHLSEKTTLKDLAKHLHFSVSQTQRLIKSYYGISFQQKVIKTKIEQTKRLIATTDLSLEEISKQVGYSSYNAFFDAFMSQTGQTPSDYRLSLQKQQ